MHTCRLSPRGGCRAALPRKKARARQRCRRRPCAAPKCRWKRWKGFVPARASSSLQPRRGAPGCITDAGTAGALVRAGATAAAYNVRINLPSVTDESLRSTLDARTREALADIGAAADRIAREVEYRLDERSAQ